MKKLLIILLLAMSSLWTSTAAMAADPLTVRVGVYENEPRIFTDDQGKVAGFWPDIIEYIAAKEDWKIEYVHGTWDDCLKMLDNQEIDLMPNVANTPEWAAKFNFSNEPAYMTWAMVYAPAGTEITSILDLNDKKVAVMKGSNNVDGPEGIKSLAKEFNVNCTFIYLDNYLQVFEMLDSKSADAGVVGKDFGYTHDSDYNIIQTSIIFQPTKLYFAVPKEAALSTYLLGKIDTNLDQLKDNPHSIYFQSLRKWFGESSIGKTVFPDWAKWMLIGIGVITLLLAGGSSLLRYQVRKKTKELADDIEKRIKTENELRDSEEKLQLIVETVPLGLTINDTEGTILKANQAMLKLSGYTEEELTTKKLQELFIASDCEQIIETRKNILATGYNKSEVFTLLKKDGTELPVELVRAMVKDTGDTILGILAVIIDLTTQKQAEEARRKIYEYQEIDKHRTNLLSTVSHELRTPLASIKGYATMMLKYYNDLKKEQQWESLEAIDQSTDRLAELLDHLLDVTRLEAGLLKLNLQPVKPRAILLQAINEAKLRAPKYTFKVYIKRRLPMVTADAARFREIIDNILNNAVKYSSEGTEITVRAEVIADELQVSITDQGRGIAEGELNKIFDHFYRIEEKLEKDPGGFGLGLSLCKALTEAHGGRIWVESQINRGSTFYFTIRIKKSKPQEDDKQLSLNVPG